MAHIRSQLRSNAKTLLTAAGLDAAKLFIGRRRPAAKEDGEIIGIYTDRETSADSDMSGGQERIVQLKFDVITKGEEEAALERLDVIATQIETAIASDPTIGDVAQTYDYRSTEFIASIEGERVFTVMSMRFDVTVFTQTTDPETGE